jgi:hypothetical protein
MKLTLPLYIQTTLTCPSKVSHYMSHFPLLNVRILSRIFMHSHVLRFEIKSSMISATFGLEKTRHLLELNHLGAPYCLCNWNMRWSTLYNWLCFRSFKDPKICVIDKHFHIPTLRLIKPHTCVSVFLSGQGENSPSSTYELAVALGM